MTLSSTDVSQTQENWTCEPLNVEDVLLEGEKLVYYVGRTLTYLDGL